MKILKKRILAYTLALAVLLSSLVFGVSTVSATTPTDYDAWEGDTATGFANPDAAGTEADPYIIETAEQLRYLLENYTKTGASKGKFFKITKDIYLNDISNVNDPVDLWGKQNWLAGYGETVPVPADNVNLFEGTLDGDGHTIYGLYVNGVAFAGLFPAVSSYATIKNLSLEKVFITGGSGSAGAIAGWAEYTSWQSATQITNCSVVDATIGQAANIEFVGGLVGRIDTTSVTVTNCYAYGLTLSQDTGRGVAGGLIGFAQSGGTLKINNSFSVGYFATCSQITKAICTNVYTTADIPEGYTNGGVTKLIEDKMKGDAAKANMALDFVWAWNIVENGYPVLRDGIIEVWDGTNTLKNLDTFKGHGTPAEPYEIENGNQLAYVVFTDLTDGLCFKLTKDIRLNDTSSANWKDSAKNWVWADVRFTGTFDGDGHTIDGLFYSNTANSGQYRVGLFSYVGAKGNNSCTIKNFKMTNAYIANNATKSDAAAGVVAGQASDVTTFENIYIDETCEVNSPAADAAGGLLGKTDYNINITNCAVHAKVTGETQTGAFVGWMKSNGRPTIVKSYTTTNAPVTGNLNTDKNFLGTASANVYAIKKQGTVDAVVTQLNLDQMKGDAAKVNMPGLDYYGVWKTTTDSYPVHRPVAERMASWGGAPADLTAISYAGGTGTKADPYLIANGDQLYKMVAENSNASVASAPETQTYFRLTSDINLGLKQWYASSATAWIAGEAYNTIGFNGVIYGDGHTVYNVHNSKVAGAAGLIPVATQGAEIHDLHIVGGYLPKVDYQSYALGGLIGLAKGAAGSTPIVIEGCSVDGVVVKGAKGAAGLVGYTYSQSLLIKDSYVVNSSLAIDEGASSAFIGTMGGSAYNNSFVVENSYTDTLAKPVMSDDFAAKTTFKNVYTTADDASITGLTKLSDAEMKGKLGGFNYNQVWQTTDNGYSVHRAFAVQKELFTGTAALEYAGGKGTEEEPYLISNADQLYKLATATREETLGNFYKLTNDISISRVYDGWANDNLYTWAAVKTYFLDTYSDSFAGTLDGAGYTVSGLYYNNEITDGGNYAYGVIPFVTANAVIKNLTVKDVNATVIGDGASVGAVIGATHLTTADAENALNFVNLVGVKAENSVINGADDNSVIGKAATGVKIDPTVADENTLIFNALNTNEDAIAAIRNNLIGNGDKYITDVNAVQGFDIADLVYATKKKDIIVDTDSYALVWAQEFDGDALDNSVWSFNTGMSQKTNLKYVEDNNEVSNGTLKLTATDSGDVDANGNKIYNVNKGLCTIDTMSFKYGRLEMKAKIPFSAGAFPSLWLTSRDAIGYEAGAYGYDNEIDIFEVFGKSTSQNQMVTCIHKWYVDENGNRIKVDNKNVECSCGTDESDGNAYNISAANRSYTVKTEAAKAEWHTIVFEWTEEAMTFSVDGEIYYTAKKSAMDNATAWWFGTVKGFDKKGYKTDNAGIFSRPMYLRLNNHMYTPGGTSYVFGGTDSQIDPGKLTYEIDYIKLYQKNDGKSEINLK